MLDVAQPTLSRQVRLLNRNWASICCTATAGAWNPPRRACAWSMPAPCWPLAERAREDLRSLRETPAGKVSVGLPPRIARADAAAGASVPSRIPGASIAVAEGLSAQVREWLLAGRVDLALL